MDVIAEIVRNLLVIIIVATILEMMLPEGSTRPFVRLAVGMFVLIAILTPTLGYLYEEKNFQISAWDDRQYESQTDDINRSGQKIQEQIAAQNSTLLQKKVEGQIGAVAILVPGVNDVEAAVTIADNGSPQKISLIVRSGSTETNGLIQPVEVWGKSSPAEDSDQTAISNKMKKLIANLYGLEEKDINVEFEGS